MTGVHRGASQDVPLAVVFFLRTLWRATSKALEQWCRRMVLARGCTAALAQRLQCSAVVAHSRTRRRTCRSGERSCQKRVTTQCASSRCGKAWLTQAAGYGIVCTCTLYLGDRGLAITCPQLLEISRGRGHFTPLTQRDRRYTSKDTTLPACGLSPSSP